MQHYSNQYEPGRAGNIYCCSASLTPRSLHSEIASQKETITSGLNKFRFENEDTRSRLPKHFCNILSCSVIHCIIKESVAMHLAL